MCVLFFLLFLHFLLCLPAIIILFAERYNKKCKNLTSNKSEPIASLTNALVRDGTARHFRWRRATAATRADKIPVTLLTGKSKLVELSGDVKDSVQSFLRCGCRIDHSAVFAHTSGKIGGKRFNPGEPLRVGKRCGSVVTMVNNGASVHGLIKKLYRVVCACDHFNEFAISTWFPHPNYPDRDPLTVEIPIMGLDINNIPQMDVIPLYNIQPSRVGVEIDDLHGLLRLVWMINFGEYM